MACCTSLLATFGSLGVKSYRHNVTMKKNLLYDDHTGLAKVSEAPPAFYIHP